MKRPLFSRTTTLTVRSLQSYSFAVNDDGSFNIDEGDELEQEPSEEEQKAPCEEPATQIVDSNASTAADPRIVLAFLQEYSRLNGIACTLTRAANLVKISFK